MNTPRPKASPSVSNDSNPASRSDQAVGKGAVGVRYRRNRLARLGRTTSLSRMRINRGRFGVARGHKYVRAADTRRRFRSWLDGSRAPAPFVVFRPGCQPDPEAPSAANRSARSHRYRAALLLIMTPGQAVDGWGPRRRERPRWWASR